MTRGSLGTCERGGGDERRGRTLIVSDGMSKSSLVDGAVCKPRSGRDRWWGRVSAVVPDVSCAQWIDKDIDNIFNIGLDSIVSCARSDRE